MKSKLIKSLNYPRKRDFRATQKATRLKLEGVDLAFTFVDGKIAGLWVLGDVQGLLKQLATMVY